MAACNLQVTTIVLFVSIFGGGERSPWYPIFNGAKMTKLNSIIIFTLEHNKIKSFECASWNYLGLNSMTGSFFLLQQRFDFYSINASMRMYCYRIFTPG